MFFCTFLSFFIKERRILSRPQKLALDGFSPKKYEFLLKEALSFEKAFNGRIDNILEQFIIQIENKKNSITVSFIDYGYPQKPELLNGIFEEYIASSHKFRKVGFGLELFNCRKIIEAHGGKISAKNELNTGTSITFSLPSKNIK